MEEYKENLLKKKKELKIESEKRKTDLRIIGLKNYNFEEIHRKHTNSVVFSDHQKFSSILAFLFKIVFGINYSG